MSLADVGHTVDAVPAVALGTPDMVLLYRIKYYLGAGAALVEGLLDDGVAGHALKAGLVTARVPLAVPAVPL